MTIKFVGVVDATHPNDYEVLVTLVQEARSEIDDAGRPIIADKRKDLRLSVDVLYTGRAWSIVTTKVMK